MAKCGIKKYDELPSRVGWLDVDYLRYRLDKEKKMAKKKIDKIKKELNKARKKWK